MSTIAKTRAHCNVCSGEKNHVILHQEKTTWEDHEHSVSATDTYSTLQCAGCDTIKLRHVNWFSEDDEPTITDFPPSIFRKKPDWLDQLWMTLGADDIFVHTRLGEIYVALQHDLVALAAMGIRSLLERIMITKNGDLGTFVKNVAKFENEGYVSRIQRERLEAILEVGHATTHRAFEPSRDDVITLVDLTEHIIQTVYLHDAQVAELKKRVPARKTKKN